MYTYDQLQKYIKESELVVMNDDFKVRLSKDLLEKYKQNLYSQKLLSIEENIKQINKLGIKYPDNTKPVFYLYIVPDKDFVKLLNFPKDRTYKGGGKAVPSYDLDGFKSAFGISNNILENRAKPSMMQTINTIHELAHLVHSMFFYKNRFISEGFAEALPYIPWTMKVNLMNIKSS